MMFDKPWHHVSRLQERSLLNVQSRAAAGRLPPPTSAKFTSEHTPGSGRTTAPSLAVGGRSPVPPTTRTIWGYTRVSPFTSQSSTNVVLYLIREQLLILKIKWWPCFFLCDYFSIPLGEKPYVCTVPGCEKRFTEYSSLYKHHVVHTPCKPYNCNHCGKTYKQISTLAMHKRTAHNDTEPIEEEQEAYFEPPAGQWKYNDIEELLKGQFLIKTFLIFKSKSTLNIVLQK